MAKMASPQQTINKPGLKRKAPLNPSGGKKKAAIRPFSSGKGGTAKKG